MVGATRLSVYTVLFMTIPAGWVGGYGLGVDEIPIAASRLTYWAALGTHHVSAETRWPDSWESHAGIFLRMSARLQRDRINSNSSLPDLASSVFVWSTRDSKGMPKHYGKDAPGVSHPSRKLSRRAKTWPYSELISRLVGLATIEQLC